jgi:hypothetical protein
VEVQREHWGPCTSRIASSRYSSCSKLERDDVAILFIVTEAAIDSYSLFAWAAY